MNEFRTRISPRDYEITFFTESEDSYRAVQDLCRKMIDKEKRNTLSQGWIRLSIACPDTEVLCVDRNGEMMIGYVHFDANSETNFSAENDTEFMYNATHFMWLPDPPKEGEVG